MDWLDVKGILEYRLASSAKAQHNLKVDDMTPEQTKIWMEMIKAHENG